MKVQPFRILLVASILLIAYYGSFATSKVDSLKSLLSKELTPQKKVVVLNELSELLSRKYPTESINYAQEALEIVNKNDLYLEKANTLLNLSYSYIIKGKLDTAMTIIEEAIALGNKYELEVTLAEAYHKKGFVAHLKGDYADALINYHDALILNEKLDRKDKIVKQLNNMALVRRELKDYKLALELLQKQRDLAEEIGNIRALITSEGNLGYVYLDLKEFEKALPHIEAGTKKAIEVGDSIAIGSGKNLLAENNLELGHLERAFDLANESVLLNQAIEYKDGIVHGTFLIAEYYFRQKEYTQAISFAKQAVELIGDKVTNRNLDRLLNILVNSYKETGNQSLAFQYQDQLLKVKEAIFNKESNNMTYRLEADAQLREQKREKELLETELEKDKKLIKLQYYLNLLFFCLAVLVFVICFLLYRSLLRRNKQKGLLQEAVDKQTAELMKRNKELHQSNQELENFAYIASHDLKEPLRNINSFSNLTQRALKAGDREKATEYLDFISKSTIQINKLVEGILEYSLLWKDRILEDIDLNDVIQEVRLKLKSTFEAKKVQLVIDDLPSIKAHPTEMMQLFSNLIENGVKYNESEVPTIKISYQEESTYHKFSIIDNGIGIQENYHDNVFKMFKRLHHFSQYQGTGLGLAIVKRIIEKMNGKVWIENRLIGGTIFHFLIPKLKDPINFTASSQNQALTAVGDIEVV